MTVRPKEKTRATDSRAKSEEGGRRRLFIFTAMEQKEGNGSGLENLPRTMSGDLDIKRIISQEHLKEL